MTRNDECNQNAWVCDLYRLSQAFAYQDDSGQILQQILENIVDRFDAGSGCLAVATPDATALNIVCGMALPATAIGQRVEFGEGIIGWVGLHKSPLLLNGDLADDLRFARHVTGRKTPRPVSAMCWPLIIEERVAGVLCLNRRLEDPPFGLEDMERVEMSVGLVTVIVENARLHREQHARMNALAEANVRIVLLSEVLNKFLRSELQTAGHDDLHQFYQELLGDVRVIAAGEHSVMGICDEQGDISEMIAVCSDAVVTRSLADCGTLRRLIADVVRNGMTRIVFPAQEQHLHVCMPQGYAAPHSILIVPMNVQGKCCGALTVLGKKDGKHFDDNDELSLGLIGNNLAMLLERIGLMSSLQRSKAALEQEKDEQKTLIRQLQDAQSQLLQSEKMASIGQLAAGVAHEINNPVGYVGSNLGSLQKYIKDLFTILSAYEAAELGLAEHQPALEAIAQLKQQLDVDFLRGDIKALIDESQEGVKRVKQIVQDLKDFSHVDQADWQWADLHKGLDSTLNVARNEIKYKAEVVKEYGDIPQIECLASQLNQVFMNLIVNGAHAIEERGVITLRTGQQGDEVWVEVADTGKGIAAENLKRIFDPFFTTKPVGKGTGLGLSLAYGIVKKHAGRIEVESEVGKGTRFRVWLPIERDATASKPTALAQQGAA